MCRFIESIRLCDGNLENLMLHQERADRTLAAYHSEAFLDLSELLSEIELPDSGLYKVRMVYTPTRCIQFEVHPYVKKVPQSIALVFADDLDYQFKYENREAFKALKETAGTDEILIIKEGHLTDSSYANIVLFDGEQWVTPDTPLLEGIQREQLIRSGQIRTSSIHYSDFKKFLRLKLINAMMPWEEAIEIDLQKDRNLFSTFNPG